jgi:DNA-directed RNA polymerase subunit alpha
MTEKEIVRDLAEKNGNVKLDDITIEELDFSVRTFNCLKRSGINNVEELVDAITTKTEIGFLCDIRNIGKKSYGEIKDKLISKGFLKE